MAPRMIRRLHVARRAAQGHIQLIVHRPGARLQAPVQGARCEVEGARVEQQEAALARGHRGEFGEADVVADGQGDFPKGRDIYQGQLVSWAQHV